MPLCLNCVISTQLPRFSLVPTYLFIFYKILLDDLRNTILLTLWTCRCHFGHVRSQSTNFFSRFTSCHLMLEVGASILLQYLWVPTSGAPERFAIFILFANIYTFHFPIEYFPPLKLVSVTFYCVHFTFSRIHGVNFDMRVQTPGRLASAHPMPHDIIPAKK